MRKPKSERKQTNVYYDSEVERREIRSKLMKAGLNLQDLWDACKYGYKNDKDWATEIEQLARRLKV